MPDTHPRIMQKPMLPALAESLMVRIASEVEPDAFSEEHGFQIGPDDGINLSAGPRTIQVLDKIDPADLYVQPLGGATHFGDGVIVSGQVDADSFLSERLRSTVTNIDGSSGDVFTTSNWQNTGPGIEELSRTFIAPPSGGVLFIINAKLSVSSSGARAMVAHELYEGTDDTGTLLVALNSARCVEIGTTNPSTGSWTHDSDVLTPGMEYFVRLGHRMTDEVTTGTIWGRNLAIIPKF